MAPIVIDPPEREPRLYKREWRAEAWRGTAAELVEAMEAAMEELRKQIPYEPRPSATFSYADRSTETVNGIEAFKETLEQTEPDEIEGVSVKVNGPPSLDLSGAPDLGLKVTAEGTHAFAVGMVGMMSFHLSGGEEAGKARELKLRPSELFLLALSPVLFVATFLYFFLHFDHHGVMDVIGDVMVGALVGFAPLLLANAVSTDYALRSGPNRFAVVREGEQQPDEAPPHNGPIWTAKAWFDGHPLLKFLLTLIVGALIAQGLDGVL